MNILNFFEIFELHCKRESENIQYNKLNNI